MRMATGDSVSLQIGLHSDDAFDKVAAFYRDKLKALAEGKQLTDMASSDAASLSLIDDKTKTSLQVHVTQGRQRQRHLDPVDPQTRPSSTR